MDLYCLWLGVSQSVSGILLIVSAGLSFLSVMQLPSTRSCSRLNYLCLSAILPAFPRITHSDDDDVSDFRPPHGGQADQLEDPLLGGQDDDDAAKRLSLSELSRKGMASQWSKAIDADVARTFGRPSSFRGGESGSDSRQVSSH